MLQFGGVAGYGAAAVGFHVRVDAAVTEDEAGGGQHRGVRSKSPAQRTVAAVAAWLGLVFTVIRGSATLLLLQVEGGRRRGHGGQGFHGALVFRRVPPLQELQEEDAQREGGGEGDSCSPRCLGHQPPRSLRQAANRGTMHYGWKI